MPKIKRERKRKKKTVVGLPNHFDFGRIHPHSQTHFYINAESEMIAWKVSEKERER